MGTSTTACCILQHLKQLRKVRGTKLIIIFIQLLIESVIFQIYILNLKLEASCKVCACAGGGKGKVFKWQLSPTPDS